MACRALQQPRIECVLPLGGTRSEWEQIFDRANLVRWDDAVERVLQAQALAFEASARRRSVPLMRRGGRLGIGPRSLAAQFRGLFRSDIGGVAGASDVWFDADFVAVDGTSGKLQSFVDYVDNAHTLRQGSSGLQSALPAADATLANAKSVTFVRATTNRYQSTRGLSLWRYLHDGTGQTQYVVVIPAAVGTDQFLLCTRSAAGGAADLGSQIVLQSTSTIACSALTAGAATVWTVAGAGSLSNGVATVLSSQYVESASPEYSAYQKGSLLGSGSSVAAPGVGLDASAVLTLGALPGGGGATSARVRAVYTFRHAHSAVERALTNLFIASQTGVS